MLGVEMKAWPDHDITKSPAPDNFSQIITLSNFSRCNKKKINLPQEKNNNYKYGMHNDKKRITIDIGKVDYDKPLKRKGSQKQ